MNAFKSFIYQNCIPIFGSILTSRNRYINVIYYHDVVKGAGESYMRINIDIFRRHMLYLKNSGYKTFTFQELSDLCLEQWNKKHLLITFDDGWLSNYTEIFDFMKGNGIKYNIFLETAKIGKDTRYLNWEQIREMYRSGIVGFGAHTYSHPNMSDMSGIDIQQEIFKVNDIIKTELGFKPKDFCFPFGAYSKESLNTVAGTKAYRRIYTSDMRYSYALDDVIVFGRNAISDNEPFKVFKDKAAGKYNIFATLLHK